MRHNRTELNNSINTRVNNIFVPIYPTIAYRILKRTNISEGLCIDIGAGMGELGMALAELCYDIDVILFDHSKVMLSIAEKEIKNKYPYRVSTHVGRVEQMPFENSSIDLVVSRGSLFFWDNKVDAFNEIYRVLRYGGYAYIGGDFGNVELFDQISMMKRGQYSSCMKEREERLNNHGKAFFEDIMTNTVVPEFKIYKDETGLWITFQK